MQVWICWLTQWWNLQNVLNVTKVLVVVSYACDQNHKVTCYGLKVIAKYLCFKKCTEAYGQQIEEM